MEKEIQRKYSLLRRLKLLEDKYSAWSLIDQIVASMDIGEVKHDFYRHMFYIETIKNTIDYFKDKDFENKLDFFILFEDNFLLSVINDFRTKCELIKVFAKDVDPYAVKFATDLKQAIEFEFGYMLNDYIK